MGIGRIIITIIKEIHFLLLFMAIGYSIGLIYTNTGKSGFMADNLGNFLMYFGYPGSLLIRFLIWMFKLSKEKNNDN